MTEDRGLLEQERKFVAIIMREFGKIPIYEGPDKPCDDPVTQGYGNALTNVLAALRTSTATPSDEGWRPIESAPDHQQLLVVHRGQVCMAMLSGDWYLPETRISPFDKDAPTHWMPLPDPPAQQ